MKHILVVYYSQSGEAAAAAKAFAGALTASDAEVTFAPIQPKVDYPYPWRSVRRFFDQMPEAVLGLPPPIHAPPFDPRKRYDLIVIACPIWFLSPAPAMQGFFESSHAAVLQGAEVVTITVSRAMWQQGSEALKRRLAAAKAVHLGNIVVTHQGSPLATLVSTPRALLFGRRDRLMGVFPEAGVAKDDVARVGALGAVAAKRLAAGHAPGTPLLKGEPAVKVKRWLVVPELLAWYGFYGWAAAIRWLGKIHPAARAAGVYAFALFLVCLILVGLPVALLGTLVTYPLIRPWLNGYVRRLAAPTGEESSPETNEAVPEKSPASP